jgi:hypothetical protein
MLGCHNVTDQERAAAEARLATALELADLAAEMVECRLRREYPEASAEELNRRLAEWYEARPGALRGDGVGRPVDWPRQ